MKIYISKHKEGWRELEIPDDLAGCSYDELIENAHRILKNQKYKGIYITENPDAVPALSSSQKKP
ncbi:MAG: hypothetical protein MI922_00185 [Bacteroidales bacterium]|nr:hypothetical protein [Bacteroidales bacterium]